MYFKKHSSKAQLSMESTPSNPLLENTAEAGNNHETMRSLSKKVAESTMRRRLFQCLLEKKVGTWEVETQALRLVMRQGKHERKKEE